MTRDRHMRVTDDTILAPQDGPGGARSDDRQVEKGDGAEI